MIAVWNAANAAHVLRAVECLSRPLAPRLNPVLGPVIATLADPAPWALPVFGLIQAGWPCVNERRPMT